MPDYTSIQNPTSNNFSALTSIINNNRRIPKKLERGTCYPNLEERRPYSTWKLQASQLSPSCLKILERIVCDQTTDYIEKKIFCLPVNMDSRQVNQQCQHGLICNKNGPKTMMKNWWQAYCCGTYLLHLTHWMQRFYAKNWNGIWIPNF